MLPSTLLLLIVACGGGPAPLEVNQDALMHHLRTLSSDAYLGRGTGEEGIEKAAAYAATMCENNNAAIQPCIDAETSALSAWETTNTACATNSDKTTCEGGAGS